jgi:phosphoribosyl-ATP pyrophosphohydrolase/phosphoribosyl-AMP cyclohydrolase
MNTQDLLQKIKYNEQGLVCAVAQDIKTRAVLMQAWMNEESLKQTMETGLMTYYSRSRQKLWVKGETSGHFQKVKELKLDCDGDCLLAMVEQTGVACHTGAYTCFNEDLPKKEMMSNDYAIIDELFAIIEDRKANPKEGSYTNYLFDKGVDKICKKVGEESAEVIIAAKNRNPEEVSYEAADLIYHLFVLLSEQGMQPRDVFEQLKKRR